MRIGCWFGHDVFPWRGVARRSVLGDRRLAARWDLRRLTSDAWFRIYTRNEKLATFFRNLIAYQHA
jgi:hypothetical protein